MKRLLFFLLTALLFFPLTAMGAAAPPKVAHVVVALCDNISQGIVPVPLKLGNGADPANNLYWGAAYGVKTFMARQPGWKRVHARADPAPHILERAVFRHEGLNITLVADAWQGPSIREATVAFLEYGAGRRPEKIAWGGESLAAGGAASLIVYVGHDGLMDFTLDSFPKAANAEKRQAALFACQSKRFFAEALRENGAHPLIWTTGNMAPEAYSLHALLMSWGRGESAAATREAVAAAYHQYQKCGLAGARRLFATGW